ncbi:DUF2274 domain-containing protein [Blastomonas sp. AAP53]|uniref:DUF2274 domain-containing protein n=1 Tax=Blastomonas sp. AAP53 TaxID=1248760 RepID=UPI00031556C0|nr:DUF2274 domain-containing protein [Blastomonas sp. AAP53]
MTRLSLADIADEKPVRLNIEIPARLHRELLDYCAALGAGQTAGLPPPERVVPVMIERFIATDRSYSRQKKQRRSVAIDKSC